MFTEWIGLVPTLPGPLSVAKGKVNGCNKKIARMCSFYQWFPWGGKKKINLPIWFLANSSFTVWKTWCLAGLVLLWAAEHLSGCDLEGKGTADTGAAVSVLECDEHLSCNSGLSA